MRIATHDEQGSWHGSGSLVETLHRQLDVFLNHVQSVGFTVGGLHSR